MAGLLFLLAVVALLELAVAYRTASEIAQGITDRLLLASARSIAEHLTFGENGVESIVPPSALGLFDLGYGDRVFYRVTTSDGRLLAGYPGLHAPFPREPTEDAHYFNGHFNGQEIRLVAVTQPIPTPTRTLHGFVLVAETLRGETATRTSLWLQSSIQQALLVVVALMGAWFMLRQGLSPVLRLSEDVEARRHDEFQPFAVASLQTELRPLVRALNGYMKRLQNQIESQRRFTADAAHQLRTPLTLLRTQATYALRASESERVEAIRAILTTTTGIARLTNQLLALARSERQREVLRRERVDLSVVTRELLEEHAPLAVERNLDLSFDVTSGDAPVVHGNPAAMRDLIVNLVDNAIRYTPAGGQIAVSVGREPEGCFIRVEDSGPGIPPDEQKRVFERFHRLREGTTEGSGLGLAIVKEIVESHGAAIALRQRVPGPGFVVEVRFSAAA